MKPLQKLIVLSTLFIVSSGAAVAQDSSAARAAQSAASAASSAASAASSAEAAKKSEEAAAAKFALPTNITVGDRIKLRSNISNLAPVNGASAGQSATVGACLRVTRLNEGNGITVVAEPGDSLLSGTCRKDGLKEGDTFLISGEQLRNASYSRYGWVYGPMVVPFKYFPHDRSFEPSQSLGMYMGYRTSWFESRGLSWVASAGLATMKVSQVVDDPNQPGGKTTKENTVAGYTFAGGVLFDLTTEAKPFVAGLLIGRDFVGRNSALTYKHDNQTWIAFQIGWAL